MPAVLPRRHPAPEGGRSERLAPATLDEFFALGLRCDSLAPGRAPPARHGFFSAGPAPSAEGRSEPDGPTGGSAREGRGGEERRAKSEERRGQRRTSALRSSLQKERRHRKKSSAAVRAFAPSALRGAQVALLRSLILRAWRNHTLTTPSQRTEKKTAANGQTWVTASLKALKSLMFNSAFQWTIPQKWSLAPLTEAHPK